MHMGSLLAQLAQLLIRHNLQLTPALYFLDKAIIMVEGNGRISNRVVYGIVLSSLVIGYSLIVLSGIPPKWHQIPNYRHN